MKIQISDNLIKHYLKNVYFINGHSYAGKSTMVKLLSERYGMIHCGENYHDAFPRDKLSRWKQPGLCYFDTMSGWEEWLSMTPEEHWNWTEQVSRECVEVEILELLRLSAGGEKVIVDTNIPVEILREISDYHHVAFLLAPQSLSVESFFDREDPEKQFILSQIQQAENPEKAMENYRECLAEVNSPAVYRAFESSGFFTLLRDGTRTIEETLAVLEEHFAL